MVDQLFDDLDGHGADIGTGAQAILSYALLGVAVTSSDIQIATRGDTEIELSVTRTDNAPNFNEIIITKPEPQEKVDERG